MRIDSAAWPFVAIATLPAAAAAGLGWLWGAGGLLVLPMAIALFFRDPARTPPPDPDARLVLSPADGKVMHAGPARAGEAPPGDWLQVTIFLSLFDVHINRTPVEGQVTRVAYVPGTFRAAFHAEAAHNEHSEIWIDHRGQTVVTRQVVGVLARRVVCRVQQGQDLAPAERIGLMKFGSRMDVFVPSSAALSVRTGERVQAGTSRIAQLAPSKESSS